MKLDRLEIIPCLRAGGSEDGCLLARYFNYDQNGVEGDNYFASLQEALQYADEVYEVGPSDWRLDGACESFRDTQEMYDHLIAIENP